jgi:hypothetical protein
MQRSASVAASRRSLSVEGSRIYSSSRSSNPAEPAIDGERGYLDQTASRSTINSVTGSQILVLAVLFAGPSSTISVTSAQSCDHTASEVLANLDRPLWKSFSGKVSSGTGLT